MGSLSGKKVVIVIAPKDFRDEEFFKPKVMLQAQGVEIITSADTKEEEATGVKGGKARIDQPLDKISTKDFDAIVFVGGPGATVYHNNRQALSLVKESAASQKVLGAICIAPVILANAGVLKGKKVTCFASEKQKLTSAGAQVLNKPVVVDGKIVTASGPEAAMDFGQALVQTLS